MKERYASLCCERNRKSGETYWTPQQKESEVFSEDTAYNIMNRMLREVVTDGTGISAQVTGLDVCGENRNRASMETIGLSE